jgi:hypothetical protein
MAWNFQRTEQQFQTIPAGDHRVVIDSAEKAQSKAGNDMLVIKLRVSGYDSMLWHYIVFMDEHPEITNRNLTQLFDSFGIADGDFNLAGWVGKAGAAHTKIDDQGYAKVAWFIHKSKQDKLPPWKGELPAPAGFQKVETPEDTPW